MIMKELSIEQKAKAYDEAIERAGKIHNEHKAQPFDVMLKVFPELKESKNERIRQWLIRTLKSLNNSPVQIDGAYEMMLPAIAWLERQGEQKPADKVEPKFRVGDVIKPKDPVLGEPRIIKGIHPKFGYDTNNGILDFEFEDNWELVEQNSAWSEEDKHNLNSVINLVHNTRDGAWGSCVGERIESWLKSLKERVQPQNTWKPSEEQMKALADALSLAKNCGEEIAFDLRTLHEQLKKLMEE